MIITAVCAEQFSPTRSYQSTVISAIMRICVRKKNRKSDYQAKILFFFSSKKINE